ncbi:MAG: hypothetical protein QM723_12895 [Myxococcaceae bacterium]
MEPFLHAWARPLVLLHGLVAMALLGATTHHALVLVKCLRGVDALRAARTYAGLTAASYVATLTLGALAYPNYRYWVRGLVLDRYSHWASNLFDMKENIASLGLPMALGALALSRVLRREEDPALLLGYAVLGFGACFATWFNVIAGMLVTLEKGV